MYRSPLNLSVFPTPAINVWAIPIELKVLSEVLLGMSLKKVTAAPALIWASSVVSKVMLVEPIPVIDNFPVPFPSKKSLTCSENTESIVTISVPIPAVSVTVVSNNSINSIPPDL